MKRKIIYLFIIMFSIVIINSYVLAVDSDAIVLTSTGGTLSAGKYYLNKNLTLTTPYTIAADTTVEIDLNGYVISAPTDKRHLIVNGELIIKDSDQNKSNYGTITDGLWNYNGGSSGVAIKGGVIVGGKEDRGGCAFVSGRLIMNGGTIAGCKAITKDTYLDRPVHDYTDGVGGAVFINNTGYFKLDGGHIKYCTTSETKGKGGAVFVDAEDTNMAATFVMSGDSTIQNCYSLFGGAVFIHSALLKNSTMGATFEMNSGTISNCYTTGTKIATPTETTDNSTELQKLYIQNVDRAGGGAVMINATDTARGTFIMNGGNLNYNKSYRDGGAVYCLGTFTMNSGNINYNKADNIKNAGATNSSYGGAVHINTSTGNFIMNDGIISNNSAASGGAIMVWTDSIFTMNGGIISNNESNGAGGLGNGGGVYVLSSTFNFNKGTLQNNKASRYGGAININQTATLNLNGECNILNNTAQINGGGISQEDGECQIKLTKDEILIDGNEAKKNGGGIFVEKGILEIKAGTISNNIAQNDGGGISLRVERIIGDITINMTGGTINNNKAYNNGGGIDVYAHPSGDATSDSEDANGINDILANIYGGTIKNNIATKCGGAININTDSADSSSKLVLGNNLAELTIESNEALSGGAAYMLGGEITINSGSISENIATEMGGALYIANGNAIINNGNINSCSAINGGAIYIENGNLQMNSGTIDGCSTSQNGGVVYIKKGNFIMESGILTNNTADNLGGALRVENGDVTIGLESCKGKDPNHECPIIKNNTAVVDGGAISMGNGLLNYYCGNLLMNVAVNNQNGNAIHQTGGTINIYGGETQNGFFLTGGELNDYRDYIRQINYHSIYDGIESTILEMVDTGTLLELTNDIFIRDNYHIVGWSLDEIDTQGYMEVGEEVYITSNVDFYAVWNENSSYMIFIPEEIELDEKGEYEISIEAQIDEFDKYEELKISIDKLEKRLYLDLNENLYVEYDIIDVTTSIPINSGDVIGTFNNINSDEKKYKIKTKEKPKYSGKYANTISFSIEYTN